ncbi:hypothetical protein AOCH_002796 [Aspergillus ochraceoroseus]|uniref:Oxidoreductase-like domain-containing protein n=1 Tax=Aspergillus ochraceoroseus TaxID=138278 RepID=A0A0F8V078_9EURO|nr:hypothetical protein AOCH_002796 [Aspergillus ochraceoroseus]
MEGHVLATVRQSMLRKGVASCLLKGRTNIFPQCVRQYHPSPSVRRPATHNHTNANGADSPQAYPLSGYYSDILAARSLHRGQATTSPTAAQQTPTSPPHETDELPKTPEEKMAIVFGTRLAGPGRASRYDAGPQTTWKTVNGVPIPPRPEEPDNCCMSGCVHCVWDDYRGEMEEWAELLAQAKAKGKSKFPGVVPGVTERTHSNTLSASMDDDGGGSETHWTGPEPGDDLFADIPVGIREFMKTEKRLKEMHRQEEASA